MLVNKVFSYLKLLKRLNMLKTLYFNLRMLAFKDALKFPFLFFGKVEFGNLNGVIKIIDVPIKPGLFRWGVVCDGFAPSNMPSKFSLGKNAVLEIRGHVEIGCGVVFRLQGHLTMLNHSFMGAKTLVICADHIFIGESSRIGFGSIIMDTNHHFVIFNDCIRPRQGHIIIGNFCWIGNNSTINKGCVLPNYTIVSSKSFVSKDYSSCGENCLLVGSPAVVKKQGVRRVFDENLEQQVQAYFDLNKNAECYYL